MSAKAKIIILATTLATLIWIVVKLGAAVNDAFENVIEQRTEMIK